MVKHLGRFIIPRENLTIQLRRSVTIKASVESWEVCWGPP